MYHHVIDKRGTYICITLHDSCVSIHGCTRSVLFLLFFSFFLSFRIHLDFPTVKHETTRISSVFRGPKVRIYFVRRKNQRIGIFFFFNRTCSCVAGRSFSKISNLFRSSKEIKTIRRRFKRFFSQNIFQRVDRILSNLNIQFF